MGLSSMDTFVQGDFYKFCLAQPHPNCSCANLAQVSRDPVAQPNQRPATSLEFGAELGNKRWSHMINHHLKTIPNNYQITLIPLCSN